MSAKEMFEKLGYIQVIRENYITYEKENKNDIKDIIQFNLSNHTIEVQYTHSSIRKIKEIQAINMQLEELGWYDDKSDI